MSTEYGIFPQSTVCLLEYSLCPQSTVYILISKLYSLSTGLVHICESNK